MLPRKARPRLASSGRRRGPGTPPPGPSGAFRARRSCSWRPSGSDSQPQDCSRELGLLPHGDVSWKALLPGAVLVAVGVQALHLFVELYLVPKIGRSSEL